MLFLVRCRAGAGGILWETIEQADNAEQAAEQVRAFVHSTGRRIKTLTVEPITLPKPKK